MHRWESCSSTESSNRTLCDWTLIIAQGIVKNRSLPSHYYGSCYFLALIESFVTAFLRICWLRHVASSFESLAIFRDEMQCGLYRDGRIQAMTFKMTRQVTYWRSLFEYPWRASEQITGALAQRFFHYSHERDQLCGR